MTDTNLAPPPAGHNNPPEATLEDRLAEANGPLIAELIDLAELANGAPKEVTTDQQAIDVTKIAADAADVWKKLDGNRIEDKAPFLEGTRKVDGFFREPLARADKIDKALMARVSAYRRKQAADAAAAKAETERVAREAAQKAQDDAEAAAAAGRTEDAMAALQEAVHHEDRADDIAQAAPIAAPEPIQHESGLTAGTTKFWNFEITDHTTLDLNALRDRIDPDAVRVAIGKFAKDTKGTRQIAGVRIFEDVRATRRK